MSRCHGRTPKKRHSQDLRKWEVRINSMVSVSISVRRERPRKRESAWEEEPGQRDI